MNLTHAVPYDAGASELRRLGVIAGGGALPAAIAASAAAQGREVFIVALRGFAGPEVTAFPHGVCGIGEVGRLLSLLRKAGAQDVVFVGHLRRPNLLKMRPDAGTFRHLPALLGLLRGGDDTLLTRVGRFMEAQGFRLVGAHDVAPELLAPAGSFARAQPRAEDIADIGLGARVIAALSPFDVGQAAVVRRGYVLAVEAAEGTDAMLGRCESLNPWGLKGRAGVLVKAPKRGQDLRLDMPTIGPRTVEMAAKAGLRGIAVAAGHVLLAEQSKLIETADAAGLFLQGFDPGS